MSKSMLVCLQCGHRTLQWLGRCPDCASWDSFTEASRARGAAGVVAGSPAGTVRVDEVQSRAQERIATGVAELDRVLGGGLVRGSVTLLAGEPGVGKSTLLLQAAAGVEESGRKVLLVCGEESPEQVAARARRLGAPRHTVLTAATEVSAIVPLVAGPDLVLVDSVQSLRDPGSAAEPGSVSQVRLAASALTDAARSTGAALVLVGHINKEGSIAGPRALEHLVDVVLTFEGDRGQHLRTVRGIKNRFGPAGELGVFEMGARGLSEVPDASRFLLAERLPEAAGSTVGCVIEGRRALALEIQALVMPSRAPVPRRIAQGIESARLGMALAVLQRHCGVKVGDCDVYASVAGGLRAAEPAVDLPLCLALASSRADVPLPARVAAVGEVGLSGEIRSVPGLALRVAELARLGFDTVFAPPARGSDGVCGPEARNGVRTLRCSSLGQARELLHEVAYTG